MVRATGTPTRTSTRGRRPSAALRPHGEVYAAIALSGGGAYASSYVSYFETWIGLIIQYACAGAIIFGLFWAGYRLIRPRNQTLP